MKPIDPIQHVRQVEDTNLGRLEKQVKPKWKAYVAISRKSLDQALVLGGLLRGIKDQPVLKNNWRNWCKRRGISRSRADECIELHDNRELLADKGAKTIQKALAIIRQGSSRTLEASPEADSEKDSAPSAAPETGKESTQTPTASGRQAKKAAKRPRQARASTLINGTPIGDAVVDLYALVQARFKELYESVEEDEHLAAARRDIETAVKDLVEGIKGWEKGEMLG